MPSPLQSDCHMHAFANLVDTLTYHSNAIDKLIMAQVESEDRIEILMKSIRDLTNDINILRFVTYSSNH